jgi:glycosyltransferase involved in cell wall biosynthesis/wyosine [tRNA(Phe)-imidazoG37] synthetase (radical SAM superfamily)
LLPLSVIICTFNRVHYLEMVFESLLRQTLDTGNYELIVINDGSSDDTEDVVAKYQKRLPISYYYQENSGLAVAKNHGIENAKGDIVFFFDDDDIAAPSLLEEHLKSHAKYPAANYAVLNYTTWAPHLPVTSLMKFITEVGCYLFCYPRITHGDVLDYTYFWGGRSSCKRSFLNEHGVFNPVFRFGCEDIELGYRLSKHGLKVVYNAQAVSQMMRPINLDDFLNRLYKQGRSQYVFSNMYNEQEVKEWCEVSGFEKEWQENGPKYKSVVNSALQLEKLINVKIELGFEVDSLSEKLFFQSLWNVCRLAKLKGMNEVRREPLEFLTTCLEKCPGDRSVEPSQLTTFHQMVRSIPEESAFPANHPVSSAVEDIVARPMSQALAVSEYWIARNQLTKAKVLLSRLFQRDEQDCRVQDAFFRAIWYETHGLPEKVGNELKGRYCSFPFESFEIKPAGETAFCCTGWLPTTIGNLFTAGKMNEVWNSEVARDIRKTIIDGSYRYCRKIHCPVINGALRSMLTENLPVELWEEQDGHLSVSPKLFALHYDRSCNLSCPSCRREKYVAAGTEAERIMRITKGMIVPLLHTAERVSLCGDGEALVSPAFRWLLSQLASVENPTMVVELQTNGQLFTEREWSRINGLSRLQFVVSVSIDASEAGTYSQLRRGGDFNRLLQNLEFLRCLRDEDSIKCLRFRCVVQEENVDQLESFILMAKRYHADNVHLQMFHDIVCSPEELSRKRVHDPSHPRHQDFLKNLSNALSHNDEIQILHEFEHLL